MYQYMIYQNNVSKVLKALPWDRLDIEVLMVELEHAGKVFHNSKHLNWHRNTNHLAGSIIVNLYISVGTGVPWVKTRRAHVLG